MGVIPHLLLVELIGMLAPVISSLNISRDLFPIILKLLGLFHAFALLYIERSSSWHAVLIFQKIIFVIFTAEKKKKCHLKMRGT
jgi:hypothetical protein